MSQSFVESLSWVPKSRGLAATLAMAFDYARSQQAVTLEHLLLALLSDSDASAVLQACSIDLGRLNADITNYLAGTGGSLPPGAPTEPVASPDLLRILEYASAAAQQSRRRDVNGAIVLAAIVGDGRSPAASMLRAQGLTFEEAVKALQKASAASRGVAPPSAAPSPQPAAEPQSAPEPPAHGPHQAPASHWNEDAGARERRDGPHQLNGATGQSTEEILATARRRVDAGRTGGQQPASASATAAGPAHPTGAPERRQSHRPEPQDHAPAAPRHGGVHEDAAADASGDGFGEAVHESPPPPPRAPVPAAAAHPPRTARAQQGGTDYRAGPGAPASQPPDAGVPEARPAPAWSPAPPVDGYSHQPQPLPRQSPPHVHPSPPPPRYRSDPPRPAPMRAPWPEPPPPPMPAGAGSRATAASVRTSSDPRRKGAAATTVSAGQLVENIPRTMTVARPETVEVRIAKADVAALAHGLQGAGAAYRHDVIITRAMSVRLRAPHGGFWIETASPETQWIENSLGLLSDDHASWRWTVTPQRRGKARLQLVVSARTVGADGLAAETALPDQVIEVKVRTNFGRTAVQWAGWIAAAAAGGVLAKFGEGLWAVGRALLIQLGAL